MKLHRLCFNRFVSKHSQSHRRIISAYTLTLTQSQRNFCLDSISLRSRDCDEEKRRAEEKTNEESMTHRRKEEEYNRQQALLNELQALKEFIQNNGNNPVEIINKLKHDVYCFNASKTTSMHKCESMRRIIWLCSKYLSDVEWYNFSISTEIETLFISFTQFFIDGMEWFTVEELCDILWTYGTLGFRPNKLMTRIVNKIDMILLQHKHQNKNMNDDDGDLNKYKAETFGYIPGCLTLPFKHNEFADIIYSFGCLRIESGNLISLLDAAVMEHYPQKYDNKFRAANRVLDGFLPHDLSNLCIGYAMMDPAFHWYKIVWGLNRHLNILSNYVKWTFQEKLNILHYDVCMRYINVGWKLHITGEMAKLIDENFIKNLPRLVAPYYDKLQQDIYDILCEQVVSDQYFCKNVEGFQVPFSRWEPRDEPAVIEPLNKLQFTRLDDVNENKLLLGRALLKQNVLKIMLAKNYRHITYWEWPQTNHLQNLMIRKKVKELDMPLTVKQNLLQHTLEPHYKPLQKGLYE